jgi:hypothetical protein
MCTYIHTRTYKMQKPSEVYIVMQKINDVSSGMTAFYSIHEAYNNASKLRTHCSDSAIDYVDCIDMENKLKDQGKCFLWKNNLGTSWIKVFVLKVEDSHNTLPWLLASTKPERT